MLGNVFLFSPLVGERQVNLYLPSDITFFPCLVHDVKHNMGNGWVFSSVNLRGKCQKCPSLPPACVPFEEVDIEFSKGDVLCPGKRH